MRLQSSNMRQKDGGWGTLPHGMVGARNKKRSESQNKRPNPHVLLYLCTVG